MISTTEKKMIENYKPTTRYIRGQIAPPSLHPKEMASVFVGFDQFKQAEFFSTIYKTARNVEPGLWENQLVQIHYIAWAIVKA